MSKLNQLPLHPLQSKAWAKFRQKTGVEVVRLAEGFQMTFHKLPALGWRIGYLPKCQLPEERIIKELIKIGKKKRCIFIKLEPNIIKNEKLKMKNYNSKFKIIKSPHPLFTLYSFCIDLTKPEKDLLKQMKAKTRYNIRLAKKHGIKVAEENSNKAFETYLKLSQETWRRQKFYAHNEAYHRLMWQILRPAGIAHLLIAYYQRPGTSKQVALAAWFLFLYKGILYYPYGGSSSQYRNLMASNLMMWEAIRFGKKQGAKIFDLWGCLGPRPDKNDPWYGFHRFKEGYGGKLIEFLGSYDLVLNPVLYKFYNLVYPFRQKILKMTSLLDSE